MSKGQLSIFLVLGIVLTVIAAIVLFAPKKDMNQPLDSPAKQVSFFIQSCLEKTATEAIHDVMLHGGYQYPDENSVAFLSNDIPLYWDKDIFLYPSMEFIENEISYHISENIHSCLGNFQSFEDKGYSIVPYIAYVSTTIGSSVQVEMEFSVVVTIGENQYHLEKFLAKLPLDLRSIYSDMEYIMAKQLASPREIPLSDITLRAYERQFEYEIAYHDDTTIILGLFYNTSLGKDPLGYLFAIRYSWDRAAEAP